MAKLTILSGDPQRVFELRDDPTSVGRAPDNMLSLDDPACRAGTAVPSQRRGWILRDLGSFNGSFVNNIVVTEHALRAGDRVQLGWTVLYFVPTRAPRRAAPQRRRRPRRPTTRRSRPATSCATSWRSSRSPRPSTANSTRTTILETIVDKGVELIKAERGFLILVQDGVLDFKVARKRDKTDDPEPVEADLALRAGQRDDRRASPC